MDSQQDSHLNISFHVCIRKYPYLVVTQFKEFFFELVLQDMAMVRSPNGGG